MQIRTKSLHFHQAEGGEIISGQGGEGEI